MPETASDDRPSEEIVREMRSAWRDPAAECPEAPGVRDQPKTIEPAALRALTGSEYFQRAIGNSHSPAVYGKYEGAHPLTIRKVYEEALIRFPAAADVIAALVFFNAVDRNLEKPLGEQAAEREP